jgi:NAD(P)-dependent dehydrogenase (short-subunit alcohol dehydrogenase family)
MTARVVIVVCSTTPLAFDAASALARAGDHVIVAGPAADLVAARAAMADAPATFVPVDLRSAREIEVLFGRLAGGLDVLIDASELRIPDVELVAQTPAELRELADRNLRAVYLCARHALRLMRPRRRGVIVHAFSRPDPRAGRAAYAATLRAVAVMSAALAEAVAPDGISVRAVDPARIDAATLVALSRAL